MAIEYKDIPGYEGLYQVGTDGSVISCEKMQRYEHWITRQELFRKVPARPVATQRINSGYLIVHLYRENRRTAYLVHRLVAAAFVDGDKNTEVNHRNGVKTDNRAENLEWVTRTGNHLHAVETGLNRQALRVTDPDTGVCYPSVAQAAKRLRRSPHTIRRSFLVEGGR